MTEPHKRLHRHPKYKTAYRVKNWRQYDTSLRDRGDITLWLSQDAIDAWTPPMTGKRGAQSVYSDLAIETALTLRLLFHLPLRQTEGFLGSVLQLMEVPLPCPDHTTLSRRHPTVAIRQQVDRASEGPLSLIVDSSGLQGCGQGAWHAQKHGEKKPKRWFVTTVTPHCRGYWALLRYADDALALFECEDDAHRFMRVLPFRLGKFGLGLTPHKTCLLGCGKYHARQALWHGKRPPTFDFLGFTHYWGRTRTGKVRLKRTTSKKRLRRALVAINCWLRQARNAQPLPDLWQALARKMRGHFNYFGVTDNSRALYRFEHAVHRLLFKGLNRRSQRRSFTWERFRRYCRRHPLPRPGRLVRLTPVGSMPR